MVRLQSGTPYKTRGWHRHDANPLLVFGQGRRSADGGCVVSPSPPTQPGLACQLSGIVCIPSQRNQREPDTVLSQHLARTIGQLPVADDLIDCLPAHHVEGTHLAVFGGVADKYSGRGSLHHGALDRHLLLAGSGDPQGIPGGGRQEGHIKVQIAQEVGGRLAGAGLVLPNDLPAGVVEAAAAMLDQVGTDHEIVGHYHQVFPRRQLAGQLEGGGTRIQIDGAARCHLRRGTVRNGELRLLHQAALGGVGGLALDPLGEAHAPRHREDSPLLFELLDIAPDGHVGYLQPFGQFRDADGTALGQQVQDLLLSLYGDHGQSVTLKRAPMLPQRDGKF